MVWSWWEFCQCRIPVCENLATKARAACSAGGIHGLPVPFDTGIIIFPQALCGEICNAQLGDFQKRPQILLVPWSCQTCSLGSCPCEEAIISLLYKRWANYSQFWITNTLIQSRVFCPGMALGMPDSVHVDLVLAFHCFLLEPAMSHRTPDPALHLTGICRDAWRGGAHF